jgi:hypothetical protein
MMLSHMMWVCRAPQGKLNLPAGSDPGWGKALLKTRALYLQPRPTKITGFNGLMARAKINATNTNPSR